MDTRGKLSVVTIALHWLIALLTLLLIAIGIYMMQTELLQGNKSASTAAPSHF